MNERMSPDPVNYCAFLDRPDSNQAQLHPFPRTRGSAPVDPTYSGEKETNRGKCHRDNSRATQILQPRVNLPCLLVGRRCTTGGPDVDVSSLAGFTVRQPISVQTLALRRAFADELV